MTGGEVSYICNPGEINDEEKGGRRINIEIRTQSNRNLLHKYGARGPTALILKEL
jgi:hypothetical protein